MIPEIHSVMKFSEAVNYAEELDIRFIPYELAENMAHTKKLFEQIEPGQSIGIFIRWKVDSHRKRSNWR